MEKPRHQGGPPLQSAPLRPQILRTLDIKVVLTGLHAVPAWRLGLPARLVMPPSVLRGQAFRGATVGLAPVAGMCLAESSGGVTTVSTTWY